MPLGRVKPGADSKPAMKGQLSEWTGFRVGRNFALPSSSSFIHSVTKVLAPAPALSAFHSLFLYFLHLSSLHLFPFHPLPLLAPPPPLLWQQLSARNKGRIQLGHQFPKQHPRVERGRAGQAPTRGGSREAEACCESGLCVCMCGGAPMFPQKAREASRGGLPALGQWLISIPHFGQA